MGDNFAENLKMARIAAEMSQKDVAEKIGVAKSTYSLYESGKRKPVIAGIKKMAAVLGVSTDDLIGIPTTGEPDVLKRETVQELLKEAAGCSDEDIRFATEQLRRIKAYHDRIMEAYNVHPEDEKR